MCGVVGVFNRERSAAPDLYIGLMSLQHRGKESAGIVTSDGKKFFYKRGMGEVPQIFNERIIKNDFCGSLGIGHNRYSTVGDSNTKNIQPIRGIFRGRRRLSRGEEFWLGHNGQVKTMGLRKICKEAGAKIHGTSDTAVIAALISISKKSTLEEAILDVLPKLEGAFSLVIMTKDKLFAIKDSFGFRPLQVAKRGEDWIVASESCVFDLIGAKFWHDIAPGEIMIIDKYIVYKSYWAKNINPKFCIFEFIYFLRPDSQIFGIRAELCRERMGEYLAKEHPALADIVIPLADSGNAAALGYHKGLLKSGLNIDYHPYALFRPHTVGRTFIAPVQSLREFYLKLKFNPIPEIIKVRKCASVDDSIVRLTTQRKVVNLLRGAGAKEVHARISSPPYRFPCFYGIDTYQIAHELVAERLNGDVEKIRQEAGLDSLGFLSLEFVIQAIMDFANSRAWVDKDKFCAACFTGEYPINPIEK